MVDNATKLRLYNGALRLCKERKLASLAEAREPRRLLDDVWDGNVVDACLEQGLWNFAMRAVKLDFSPSIEPPFGYTRAFTKPDDYIRLAALTTDPYYRQPLLSYVEEAGLWFSDLDTIFLRYISNDAQYGNDASLWPQSFFKMFEAYLAHEVVGKLTSDEGRINYVRGEYRRTRLEARSRDAQSEAVQFPPTGSWVRARRGGGGGGRRQDGGGSSGLLG